MKINHKVIKTRLYITFWVILIISFVVAVSIQGVRYAEFSKKEDEVMAQITEEQQKAEELNRDSQYYESDAFVEKIAREQLGYIRADEKIFYVDEE